MNMLPQIWNKALFLLVVLALPYSFPASAQTNREIAPAIAPVIAEVTRVKHEATVERGGVVIPVQLGMALRAEDKVLTQSAARLEITFVDGSVLTLGEQADITLDSYVYSPDEPENSMAVSVAQGVFLFVSGDMGKQPNKDMKVFTALATIGIRGTTFWGGPLDNPLEVLVMDGIVEVQSPEGSVVLDEKGEGTSILAPGQKPLRPMSWPKEKRIRAFATVAF